jgi:hypothetical protein
VSVDRDKITRDQLKESVAQDEAGITVRLATTTCPCGRIRSNFYMYRCLYCEVMFCNTCAEEHFGQTVAEYKARAAEEGDV